MKNLIKETLADRFNLDNFTSLTKNIFNEIDINPHEIPASGTEGHIKKFTFLGEFSDSQKRNIDVLAVELAGDTKVERARAFQRNLIAKYLKDNIKDAGLVAFYSRDNPDWRLSFVKVDYKLTDKGVKVDIGTPPKRYSFLVGQTEPSHTAQKQLLPILEDHKNNPLVSEIEDAFSVEKVTKEFYEKYRKLFENLSKDLKKNRSFQIIASKENIDIDNFAKKLLGQIVFLYFLQKKGWLGVPQDKTWGQGDKFFLRTLFDRAKREKKNFYDNYLELLFYDTLNNPRRDEVDPAYSRYFDSKIPFLNGGLFEPDYDWKNTIVYLEDDIFEDIIGTFDLYNFTVKEDEPLEKEVAVDPEMLGKVFENLLSENLRKGQGAYYTPREIVHYMCQESLINHLSTETKVEIEKIRKLITFKDNIISELEEKPGKKVLMLWENEKDLLDKALSGIKVCDPACGSGAFLVGMLNEIIYARHILNPKKGEYLLKKETIQNSIYGVDIDPGAVEIAKLRLWLSLVVDYELRDIEPLPNLDYKIMCGNSLLEDLIVGDESIKLFDEKLLNISQNNKPMTLFLGGEVIEGKTGRAKNEYLENLLKEKQKEILDLNSKNKLTPEKKRGLEQEIKAISKELNPKSKKSKNEAYHFDLFGEKAEKHFNKLKELHKEYFTEYDPVKKKEKRRQIENIEIEFIKSSIKEKVDEIDTKIKNLNMQDPDDRKKQTVLLKKKLECMAIPGQIHESKTRPYFLWKLNFFEVFQEKGGFDVVIANPPYINTNEMKETAELYKRFYKTAFGGFDIYVIFFEHAVSILKPKGTLAFITSNKYFISDYARKLRQFLIDNTKVLYLLDLADCRKVFQNVLVSPAITILSKEKSSDYHFKLSILKDDDLTTINNLIYSLVSIKNLATDQNNSFDIYIKDENKMILSKIFDGADKLGDIAEVRTGIMGFEYWSMEPFIEEGKKNPDDIRMIINSHIEKYAFLFGKKVNLFKKIFRNPYLDIKRSPINENTKRLFLAEKIIVRGVAKELVAQLDSEGYAALVAVHTVISSDQKKYKNKFLLSLLNSSLLNWFHITKFYTARIPKGSLRYPISFLKGIPIKAVSLERQKAIVSLVDKILLMTKNQDYQTNSNKQAKVKEYERQIDQMVYNLYGLTDEEIKTVEGAI